MFFSRGPPGNLLLCKIAASPAEIARLCRQKQLQVKYRIEQKMLITLHALFPLLRLQAPGAQRRHQKR
jgi:hypothetical protein